MGVISAPQNAFYLFKIITCFVKKNGFNSLLNLTNVMQCVVITENSRLKLEKEDR